VAAKATGVVTVSTSATNWNTAATHWRLYQVETGVATVTSYTDGRRSQFDGSAGAGGAVAVTQPDVPEQQIVRQSQWLRANTAADNGWLNAAWAPELGLFAAVSNTGTGTRVMTSPTGQDWTIRTSAQDNSWNGLAWGGPTGGKLFVAVSEAGSNRAMTSPDGATWTVRNMSGTNAWRGVAWSEQLQLFCAVGQSGALSTSPDGITWTGRTAAEANDWQDVVWSEELAIFVAIAETGTNRVMYSADGLTWLPAAAASADTWRRVTWGAYAGVFVAVARTGTNRIMTSPDGITWTARTSALGTSDHRAVAWSPELGLFAIVTDAGTVQSSPDGVTWTARTAAAALQWRMVVYSPQLQRFVAVGASGTGNRAMVWGGKAGIYLPVLTNTTNVSASTAYPLQWSREGRVVTVSGQVDITTSGGAAANVVLLVSLPVPSAFVNTYEVGGSWIMATDMALVRANTASAAMHVNFTSSGNGAKAGYIHATYRVVI
jgi:hypothetical protein